MKKCYDQHKISKCQNALAVYIAGSNLLLCIQEGGKGGGEYRSRFTENKTALSQITKNMTGISRFTKNMRERFGKSRFTATIEVTMLEEKNSHFTSHGKLKWPITGQENTLYHPHTRNIFLCMSIKAAQGSVNQAQERISFP